MGKEDLRKEREGEICGYFFIFWWNTTDRPRWIAPQSARVYCSPTPRSSVGVHVYWDTEETARRRAGATSVGVREIESGDGQTNNTSEASARNSNSNMLINEHGILKRSKETY